MDTDDIARLEESAATIRTLNDELRTKGIGGEAYLTRGVRSLQPQTLVTALAKIRTFTDWTPENDPHQEHDCGVVTADGARVMFKIDYYDERKEMGSRDPADPEITTRVMTILLPDEY